MVKKRTAKILFEIDVRLADYNSLTLIKKKVINIEKILMFELIVHILH